MTPAPPGGTPGPGDDRRLPAPLRWALLGLAGYGVVVVLLLGGSAWEARQGLSELERLRDAAGPDELLDGSAAAGLDDASSSFARAEQLADNPVTAPVRILPVLGRQVRAVGGMAAAAAELSEIAADGVEEAAALADGGLPAGQGRVELLEDLAAITDEAAARLAVVDLGPEEALIGPVGTAHDRFAEEQIALEETLLDTRDAAAGMAGVFAGPSDYLLLAANNAEMRAGAGMALSAGVLHFEDGEVELGDMESTAALELPGGVEQYDAELAELWGFANPDEEWRNLLLSPRYPASAALGRQMWDQLGRPPIDGVLTVDIAALEGLLGALGPVEVDGQRIGADNVVRLLQHDQYLGVENDEQAARRDRLGDVAREVVDRLDQQDAEVAPLLSSLREAAAGRHLLLWSEDRGLQRAWTSIGVGGEPGPEDLLVGVLNEGNNKLDQFLRVDAELVAGPGRAGRLVLEVTNEVPEGEPAYIAGVAPERVGGYGVYPGYLAVSLPGGTSATVAEGPEITVGGPDGDSQMVAALVRIAPGETVRWVLDLEVPETIETVRIAPSARLPAVHWTVDGATWQDDLVPSRRIEW